MVDDNFQKSLATFNKEHAVAAGTRRTVNLTGLVKVEIAPGVFFYTNSTEAKVKFSWDTGASTGTWESQ